MNNETQIPVSTNRGYGMTYRCARCREKVNIQNGFRWTVHRGVTKRICKPCGRVVKDPRNAAG